MSIKSDPITHFVCSRMTPSVTMKSLLIFLAGIYALTFSAETVFAERLESDSYVIQFGNFNMTAGEKSSASYNVTDTVGQTGAGPFGEYGSSGYFVGSGFQYIYQIDEFSFRLSKTAINLGSLTANAHNTDSHTMTITTRGAGGYTIYAYETTPLLNRNGVDTIPNTTCDAGTCSYTAAGLWTNVNIGGFGFNINGNDTPVDFVNSNYYRALADRSASEPMQVVMSSTNIASERTATVTYKAGLFGSEASGSYETGVSYVAVPGY